MVEDIQETAGVGIEFCSWDLHLLRDECVSRNQSRHFWKHPLVLQLLSTTDGLIKTSASLEHLLGC